MTNTKTAIAGLAIGLSFMALPAAATVITIGTSSAVIECAVSCQGFIGAGGLDADTNPSSAVDPTGLGVLSDDKAQLYDGAPSSIGDEGADLAALIGSAAGAGVRTTPGDSVVFNSAAQYFAFKLGNTVVYIKNTSGAAQDYVFLQNGAQGLGLSHVTAFGSVAPVPLPAAVWLMGAGLAGLGFASRKKKQD